MASNSRARAKSSSSSKKESPYLQEILVTELQEIHSAEKQLARLIPRLAKAADNETLQECIEERLEEGEQILADVESALEELEATPGRKKNVAAEGLVNDMKEHVQELQQGPALDTVLIGALQKTEHYCMAAWGTVKALAQATGQQDLVGAMERALEEGSAYDERLTQLAESEITPELQSQGEGMEAEEDEDRLDASLGGAQMRRGKGRSHGVGHRAR
jgi:ferritin-like metal-binding protein YciE